LSIEIRDARREDVPEIQDVARTTWNSAYRDIFPGEVRAEFIERAYSRAALAQRIGDGVFLVAVADGWVVGFADFHPVSPDEVELAAIYVLPEAQGRGVGTRLLEVGIGRFAWAKKFTLRVERENAPARRFYENRGFAPGRHLTEHFLDHELHEVQMMLEVGKASPG
jgi:GNAT superfamily N-acetyltransferase